MTLLTVNEVDAGPGKISRSAEVNAPAADIFQLIADPHRHSELDGGGTVIGQVTGPDRLSQGAKFSVKMKQYGFPYRITSKVTEFTDNQVVEWQHPLGHRWRWELASLSDNSTLVTETFDYSSLSGAKASGLKMFGSLKHNMTGIEATLSKLQARFS
jgi:hypothetical protein